jgi:hypothetical protein
MDNKKAYERQDDIRRISENDRGKRIKGVRDKDMIAVMFCKRLKVRIL